MFGIPLQKRIREDHFYINLPNVQADLPNLVAMIMLLGLVLEKCQTSKP